MYRFISLLTLTLLLSLSLSAQQVADSAFQFHPVKTMYPKKNGPTIYVDEAHHNFHTLSTRYYTFGRLLNNDGYAAAPFKNKFSAESLRDIKFLVIANATADSDRWVLPTPTAFTMEEASALKKWVSAGGSLFLIIDHMPCPGAARFIGKEFGINLYNGFAVKVKEGPETFTRAAGQLKSNNITNGRNASELVDSITIFGGHAFLPVRPVIPIIAFNDDHKVLFPIVAGNFEENTPVIDASGLYHSVAFKEGKGRVVIAAEAAMFSAQLAGPEKSKMGMNAPEAKRNPQLLLNIIHWLDGKLD